MAWSLHFDSWAWGIAAVAAFFIGLSKTGVGGVGLLAVILFSSIVPAKQSSGLVLIMLITADVVAVTSYHRHAVWRHLWRLFPWTMAGVLLGWWAMGHLDDGQVRRIIGAMVAALVLFQIYQRSRKRELIPPHSLGFAAVLGLLAGFSTMMANAAGPIMTVYLLAMGLPKLEFVGTGAWYFLLMNCFKVPFSWDLGLINAASLKLDLILAPLVLAGAFSGKALLKHIPQRLFEDLALGFSLLASLRLLLY